MPIFVAIQGPTCSGKSSLAQGLCDRYERSLAISLDRFYRPFDRTQSSDPLIHNFDSPDSLDWDCLLSFVASLEASGRGMAPIFDYVTGDRSRGEEVSSSAVVVLEGLWPFVNAKLLCSIAVKIYIDAAPDLRLIRRLRRDVLGVSRGYDLEGSLLYYEECSRPMERDFIAPGRQIADLVVSGEAPLSKNVELAAAAIDAHLPSPKIPNIA